MTDNVTPFRKPAPFNPDKRQRSLRDPDRLAMLSYGLAALAFGIMWAGGGFLGWFGIGVAVAALAISATRRDEGPGWVRSHFEFNLRTIVIAGVTWMLLSVAAILTTFLPILGAPLAWAMIGVLIWVLARCAIGIVRLMRTRPIPNPASLLA